MLTPQAIKDQEFQIKFRGYDAIEVKAYLELLAEDYFELSEQNRIHVEEIESLVAEQKSLTLEKEALVVEVKSSEENSEGIQAEIEEGNKDKEKEINELKAELEEVAEKVATFKEENETYRELTVELEEKLEKEKEAATNQQDNLEKIQKYLKLVEEENSEIKQQEMDFKTTIVAAQSFADSLRRTSEEEAKAIMDEARADAEKYRNEMSAQLAKFPKEIEELKNRKLLVREELKTLLNSYLEAIDVFSDAEKDDHSELFQSIQIPDEEIIAADD